MRDKQDPTRPPGGPAAGAHRKAPPDALETLLSRGEAAARAGQRSQARRLFQEALALDPTNEDAWLWLAYLAPSPAQSVAYLEKARDYHPTSQRVREGLAWARARLDPVQPTGEAGAAAGQPEGPEPSLAVPRRGPSRSSRRARPRAVPGGPMARPLVAGRPGGRAPRAALVALAVTVTALVVVTAYGLTGRRRQAAVEPAPGPRLAITPASDTAALREQANQAIDQRLWAQAIQVLEHLYLLSPDDDGVRQQLAAAHLRYGLQLVDADRLEEGIAHYDAAIRLYANDMDLQTARRLAVGYRDGRQAVAGQRWEEAVDLLEPVYRLAPTFRDVASLLFTALLERGRALEGARQLEAARQVYARAVEIRPDAPEARQKLAEITAILTPPTPTPTPMPRKRIVVDVSEQRLRAYENDRVVFDWVCSTGGVATPTQYGRYQILDKIPEAWSSTWGLRMPYWMGIYWAGASENGIHGLPLFSNGQVLWAGYLGRRISYGCIVLDTRNAARLYQWADIGTPVTVQE